MSCESLIKRYINSLPREQIFTTGEVLNTGDRAEVDHALRKLVDAGQIHRLTRGVFVQDKKVRPSVFEIAMIKAKRFGKTIVKDCPELLRTLELNPNLKKHPVFASSGRDSSFSYGDTIIYFKGVSARKLKLGESKVAQTIRAIWYIGNKVCNHLCRDKCERGCQKKRIQKSILKISHTFGPQQLQWLNASVTLFPAWIADLFSKMFEPRFRSETDSFGKRSRATNSRPAAQVSRFALPFEKTPTNQREQKWDRKGTGRWETTLREVSNPLLKGWLRTFPIDRRILRKHPTRRIIVFLNEVDSTGKSRRFREMEEIASKYPELTPREFVINREKLQRAISAFQARIKGSNKSANSRAGPS